MTGVGRMMIWLFSAAKYLSSLRTLFFVIVCAFQIAGCEQGDVEVAAQEVEPAPWWSSLPADVMVGDTAFYARSCSITQVETFNAVATAKVVFSVPNGLLSSCDNSDNPLTYDGKYLILEVCQVPFAAGGCAGGRYRSADLEHWEEYIGVTWIKREQYEAWRKLGSTSSKADFFKKL